MEGKVGKAGDDFRQSAVEGKRRLVIIPAITALSPVARRPSLFIYSFRAFMLPNLCLLTCALATAQAGDRSDWLLVPRLHRGQELVYRGSYAEEAIGKGVQVNRAYRLETRIFVLDTPPRGTEASLQTGLKLRLTRSERGAEPEPSSVRLEVVRVDLQGRITANSGVTLSIPLEGPATVEHGAFVEVPSGRLSLKQTWEVLEANRPAR